MPATVALTPRRIDEYSPLIGEARTAELRRLAAPVRGLRVLGLSLSAFGSWLTDLLSCSVPLLQDLGVDASWQIVHTDHTTERATVALYEALNGDAIRWTAETRREWQRYLVGGASELSGQYDLIIVHDPQLMGLVPASAGERAGHGARWLWNCHLDLSGAAPAAWADLQPFADRFDAVALEDPSFAPPGWQPHLVQVIPPGIDPLGPRNVPMEAETAALLIGKLGIDAARPLIAQISPFDVGSDALGLIEVYDILRERVPALQLAIVPSSIRDDQETRSYFNAVARLANDRPGCTLLPVAAEIGNAEINAFRQVAQIVVQKSLRKGFALWLSEAMWQRRPVVAGRSVGSTAQVVDGVTGALVPSTQACAEAIATLLHDAELRTRLGENGRRHVANHFLVTRYLADLLQLMARVVGAGVQA